MQVDIYFRNIEKVTMEVEIYFRNIEKVTMQVDNYFRNIEIVTMQVGAGDFPTESPAGARDFV